MPRSTRDYTDSEGESESAAPPREAYDDDASREGSPTITHAQAPTAAGPSEPHHPIRITLRPNLSHLVNDPTPLPLPASSDRSSLSPPPPITLRLNRPSASTVDRAYSSSEDEDRPSKKAKLSAKSPKSKSSKSKPSSSTSAAPLQGSGSGSMPAPHRKAYDWLAPASASASHHGPPERKAGSTADIGLGGEPGEMDGEWKKSRSHKKRPADAPPGPGKAWRKGLKKGMQIPWREGMTFMGEPGGPAIVQNNGKGETRREYSPDSSSEPEDGDEPMDRPEPPPHVLPPTILRPSNQQNSGSFVAANAEELGIPIYKKPIVAPKIALSTFPKVTQFFAPINGGDPVFPRKEKVRSWKHAEKSIGGIGGGGLKVKIWAKGPASELSRIVQADREAREAARLAKKAAAAEKAELGSEGRPPLVSTMSYDSTGQASALEGAVLPEMAGSEGGDEDSAAAGEHSSPVAVAPAGKTKKKSKPKPKKSKLAQEIMPSTPDGEAESDILGTDPIEA